MDRGVWLCMKLPVPIAVVVDPVVGATCWGRLLQGADKFQVVKAGRHV